MQSAALEIIERPDRAAALLDATRLRLVGELDQPDSAAGLARRLGLPRQRVNYHLRELEKVGLVEFVEERRKRNCTERVVRATARSYLISPRVLAELGSNPDAVKDRFSWSYLIAVAARAIKELAVLRRWADRAGKKLVTLTFESEVNFSSPKAQHAFSEELANEIARLTAKYHADDNGGRKFRLIACSYPAITKAISEMDDADA